VSGEAASARAAPWGERVALTAVFLANGIGIGAWAASIAFLKARLALSDGELGCALFAFAAGAIVAMSAASRLALLSDAARATRYSALAFAGLLALPLLAANVPALIGATFVVGAANGLMDVAMNAHASGVERRWGAAIMSSFHAAFSVGGLVGAALGGLFAATGASAILGGGAVLAAALAVFAWPLLAAGDPVPPAAKIALAIPMRAALPLCAAALLSAICEGAMADWTGVYLADVVRTRPEATSLGYAAFSAAMVAGRLTGDGAVRAWGRARVVSWGAWLASAGLALAVFAPSLATAAIGFALVGIGLSNVVPVLFSAASGLAASPAAGVAMAALGVYAGLLGGPVLIGAIAQGVGLRAAIGLLIVCAAAAALTARALRR
jgi:hypothetical protein